MSSNVVNQMSYLRTSREFPEEIHKLTVELSKSYIDIANAVNYRTISIFPSNRPAVNGESWYVDKNQRQQGFRQVYTFTSTVDIIHSIDLSEVSYMIRMFGQFTDGTNWYGLIPASPTAIAGQISFYITPTVGAVPGVIKFVLGAGSPILTKGIIVLEWLSQP